MDTPINNYRYLNKEGMLLPIVPNEIVYAKELGRHRVSIYIMLTYYATQRDTLCFSPFCILNRLHLRSQEGMEELKHLLNYLNNKKYIFMDLFNPDFMDIPYMWEKLNPGRGTFIYNDKYKDLKDDELLVLAAIHSAKADKEYYNSYWGMYKFKVVSISPVDHLIELTGLSKEEVEDALSVLEKNGFIAPINPDVISIDFLGEKYVRQDNLPA